MTAGESSIKDALVAYLTTNRDFLAETVAEAVDSLGLAEGGHVLGVGTGGGGALPALARAVGGSGTVLAIDLNPDVLPLALEYAERAGAADRVTPRAADVAAVLAGSAAAFDAIWAGDCVWPGNFDDPAEIVSRMAAAVRPGGIVALYYSNYYQSSFLPGRSRRERMLRTASEMRWGLPADGPAHNERHLAWLGRGCGTCGCGSSHGSPTPLAMTRRPAATSRRPSGPSCSSRPRHAGKPPASRPPSSTRSTSCSPPAAQATSWTSRATMPCTRRSWPPADRADSARPLVARKTHVYVRKPGHKLHSWAGAQPPGTVTVGCRWATHPTR